VEPLVVRADIQPHHVAFTNNLVSARYSVHHHVVDLYAQAAGIATIALEAWYGAGGAYYILS
jgi:hypothetical protein